MEQTTSLETGETNDLTSPLVLAAPVLHAAMVPSWAPAGIRCLNPGILSPAELAAAPAQYFTSQQLPFSQQEARARLQDLLAYAFMHNKPGELSSLAASGFETPFASSALDFRKELVDIAKISGKVLPPENTAITEEQKGPNPELIRAQLTLLLTWAQEERLLELGQLSQKLANAWGTFDQALGLENTGEDSAIGELGSGAYERSLKEDGPETTTLLPWNLVLPHMLCFVPAGSWLLFFDPQLLQHFSDAGIAFAMAEAEDLSEAFPSGGVRGQLARTTGAALLGKNPSSASPWLANELHVLFPAAGEKR